MLDYALGELGVLPEQFWYSDYTWNEYDRAVRGYELRQVREWERLRWLTEHIAAFAGVDLKKELKGRRLLDLPTDPPRRLPPTETEAEFMARMAKSNFFRPAHGNA